MAKGVEMIMRPGHIESIVSPSNVAFNVRLNLLMMAFPLIDILIMFGSLFFFLIANELCLFSIKQVGNFVG